MQKKISIDEAVMCVFKDQQLNDGKIVKWKHPYKGMEYPITTCKQCNGYNYKCDGYVAHYYQLFKK